MELEEAGQLLHRFQQNEWDMERRDTKKARKEQREIIAELLSGLCCRTKKSNRLFMKQFTATQKAICIWSMLRTMLLKRFSIA